MDFWDLPSSSLHFLAFLFLRSDALPAANRFEGKRGELPSAFLKVVMSYKVSCPRTQQANLSACTPQPPF